MKHRGEIIKEAVRQSGYPIIRLVTDMGKSKSWLYKLFKNPKASFHFIKEIGLYISYDFSKDFKELNAETVSCQEDTTYKQAIKANEYWKHKYISLLEEYTALLKKNV